MTTGIDLPNIPVPLSRLVLGTMTFGDTVDAASAADMLDAALDAGITGVDTANGYAGGESERILAGLLPGRRDRIVLATKAGIPHPDQGDHAPLSAAGLRAALEGSLKRLGTDSVDLFYLHQPDRATPLAETLATIAELVAEGKIRALGVSNYAAWQISELVRISDELYAPRPVIAQQLHNLLVRRIEEEYVEYAAVTGLRTMVYNPLGGGLLTGRHHFEQPPESGRFGDSKVAEMYWRRYWDERLFTAVGPTLRHRRSRRNPPERPGPPLAPGPRLDRRTAPRRLQDHTPAGQHHRRRQRPPPRRRNSGLRRDRPGTARPHARIQPLTPHSP